jgi:dihydroflavonol-4-reductase
MNRDDFQVLVVNPTSIIGPYDFKPSRIGNALLDLCNGKLRYVVRGGFDFCDSRDVAHAIANALTMGMPGQSYLLSGRWQSLQEIVSLLSALRGRKIGVLTIPPGLAIAGLPFAHLINRMMPKEGRYTREALDAVLKSNKQIDSSKAMRDLQYKCRSLEETLCDTIQWFEESGYFRKPR